MSAFSPALTLPIYKNYRSNDPHFFRRATHRCRAIVALAVAASIAATFCSALGASTISWSGSGNLDWSNGQNWNGGSAPGTGDVAEFNLNDYAGVQPVVNSLAGAVFEVKIDGTLAQGAQPLTIGGGGGTLAIGDGGIVVNVSWGVGFNAPVSFLGGGALLNSTLPGTVTLGSGNVDIDAGSGTVTVNATPTLGSDQNWSTASGKTLMINGPILGNGYGYGITANGIAGGGGSLVFSAGAGSSNFTGPITVNAGSAIFQSSNITTRDNVLSVATSAAVSLATTQVTLAGLTGAGTIQGGNSSTDISLNLGGGVDYRSSGNVTAYADYSFGGSIADYFVGGARQAVSLH